MKKRKFLGLVAAGAGVCAFPLRAFAKDFRIGLITPPSHVWTQVAKDFASDLREATGGKHTASVFDSGQLGNEAQLLQQLQTGALDMAFLTNAELSNRSVKLAALHAPYLVKNVSQARELLRRPETQELLTDLPKVAGVVGIGFGMGGMRQILSRLPVETVADLTGRKTRVTPVPPVRDFYNELGAASTPLPLPAVYDALANGQVDAIDMDLENIIGLKYHELAKTILLANHMIWPMVGVVSARLWKTLDEVERTQISELMTVRLQETQDVYLVKEAEWDQELRATDKTVVDVGADFFGDGLERWEKIWSEKSPALAPMRKVAASIDG